MSNYHMCGDDIYIIIFFVMYKQHSLTDMYVRTFLYLILLIQCLLQNSVSSSLSLPSSIYPDVHHNYDYLNKYHHHLLISTIYFHFNICHFYFHVSSLHYYYRMDGLLSTWPVGMVNQRLYVLQWNLESTRRLRIR